MTIWRWCALFSVVMVAIALSFGRIGGIDACGGGPLGEPIISFEFVQTPSDVEALFQPACRATIVRAQHTGLLLDIFGFVPAYVAMLLTALLALSRKVGVKPLLYAGAAFTIVAAICDQVENVQLLRILDALPGTPDIISILMPAVRIKFGVLAVAVLCVGALLIRAPGVLRWFALPIHLGGVVSIYALAMNPKLLGLGGLLSFASIAIVAIAMSVRGASARAAA